MVSFPWFSPLSIQGLEPITSSFALGVDDEFQADLTKPLGEAESIEDLGEPEKEVVESAPLREKSELYAR